MGVLFILIIIGILAAISLYIYENSQFSKITGYSYFKIWTNKDIRLRFSLVRILHKVPGEYKVLLNVKLPAEQNRIVDAIFIHTSGVYVVDLRKANGWIFGREQDTEWAQAVHHDKIMKFDNPITENCQSILLLKQLLPKTDVNRIHSLIVFSNNCVFSKIEVQSNNVEVIKTNEVKKYLSDQKEVVLTNDQIHSIYTALEKYMDFAEPLERLSAKYVNSRLN